MSIDVKPVCEEGGKCQLQMEQTVDMVLDVERALGKKDSPVPKPPPIEQLSCDPGKPYADDDACFPLSGISDLPWSLSEIFGRPIRGSCPLAVVPDEEPEHVCVAVAEQRSIFVSQSSQERKLSPELRCFTLQGTSFPSCLG
jgi:phosphatidylinositol glycan class T